jgi:hypothetical protein
MIDIAETALCLFQIAMMRRTINSEAAAKDRVKRVAVEEIQS